VHHASFSDFLRDPARSHEYTLDDGAVHRNVAVNGLRWMSMSHATPGNVIDLFKMLSMTHSLCRYGTRLYVATRPRNQNRCTPFPVQILNMLHLDGMYPSPRWVS
jgi:hypothetical protein